MRAAALEALPCVPSLGEGCAPEDIEEVVLLWLARHDPDEKNATAAMQLWDNCGALLPSTGVAAVLMQHLGHIHEVCRLVSALSLSTLLRQQSFLI